MAHGCLYRSDDRAYYAFDGKMAFPTHHQRNCPLFLADTDPHLSHVGHQLTRQMYCKEESHF